MVCSLVCKEISCPYWGDKKNFGCQRYCFSTTCHLLQSHKTEFSENEYAIYAESPDPDKIKAWANENNAYFLEDNKYYRDLKFQEDFPDFFDTDSFQVKQIKTND